MNIINDFGHYHAGHCESGVMSTMLRNSNLEMSEAMVFGLSGAMTFAYIPFIKLGGMPLIAYRDRPKAIINGIQKSIGLKMKMVTFRSEDKGMDELDRLLDEGRIVGAQTSVYWLDYFPESMRFHFNAHNLIIYGKEDDEYLVSDPVFETPMRCSSKSMRKARFVKGLMAPKGLLYYIDEVPENIDYKKAIVKSIRKTAKVMARTPIPIAGVKGIKKLARDIRGLKNKKKAHSKLFLGHIVRMQEEIGTGGAGFRFIYAAFLQEAADILKDENLVDASLRILAVGDKWRAFALKISKAVKSKKSEVIDFDGIADALEGVADDEKEIYEYLLSVLPKGV